MIKFINYLPIFLTIFFTVNSQLLLKWRIDNLIQKSENALSQIQIILRNIFDPIIILCFLLGFMAAISWIFTLTKFNLSTAYPFMALTYLIVIFLSSIFLGETLGIQNILASLLIIIGISLLV